MVTSEGSAVSKLSSFQVPAASSHIIPLLKDGSRSRNAASVHAQKPASVRLES